MAPETGDNWCPVRWSGKIEDCPQDSGSMEPTSAHSYNMDIRTFKSAPVIRARSAQVISAWDQPRSSLYEVSPGHLYARSAHVISTWDQHISTWQWNSWEKWSSLLACWWWVCTSRLQLETDEHFTVKITPVRCVSLDIGKRLVLGRRVWNCEKLTT